MPPVLPLADPPADETPITAQEAMAHALAAYQRGDAVEAERICGLVLEISADCFEALYLSGIIAGRSGRTEQAAKLLSKAVTVKPDIAEAHYFRGIALGELNRRAEALESYERAIALKPDHVDSYYNRGVLLAALDRPGQALESYDRAIALKPDYAEAHNNRGIVLNGLERYAEAVASYERAIALKPDYARALNNRGAALGELNRFDEALQSYERALLLAPNYAEAHNNRGIALGALDRPTEALASYERAIALQPDYAEAFYNRGNALRELHRYREAVESYERALALKPDYAAAHWNLADCRLMLGDFARGWQEYEWRWKLQQRQHARRDFAQPLWVGAQPLDGRTILLHGEFGLGDTLQFCRYANEVAARGAKVVLEVQPPLLPLLADLEGVLQTVPRGAPLPEFDFHCPLMSLPLAFKTDLSNVPVKIPYIRSNPSRVAAWQQTLPRKDKPRVGLVWSGSMSQRNDKRSMALEEMLPLVGEWAQWLSLQKEVRESERALLAARADLRHVGDDLNDFADTAAVIELIDVLVTVDTSVAHVAGALGKPVWILLPFNPHDWRWMLDREDSIWYPSARLFRQPAAGDWESVIRRVNEELPRRFDPRRA